MGASRGAPRAGKLRRPACRRRWPRDRHQHDGCVATRSRNSQRRCRGISRRRHVENRNHPRIGSASRCTPFKSRATEIAAAKTFGLVVLHIEPGSPAAQASLLPGDILLGAGDKPFSVLDDLSRALRGEGSRTLRLEFLRGDYARIRRVTVQLGTSTMRSSVAA